MHISDGILPIEVAVGGYAVAAGVTWFTLRQIERTQPDPRKGVPKASMLAAAFFVASLVHIPLPPTSVHLVLPGLMGVVLGWYAFPAILIGLFFQAAMLGHGGLTTLGVNAVIIGTPALAAHLIFSLRTRFNVTNPVPVAALGFLSGFTAVALGALAFSVLVVTAATPMAGSAVQQVAMSGLFLAYMPLAVVEGVFAAMVVLFLLRVQPRLLEANA